MRGRMCLLSMRDAANAKLTDPASIRTFTLYAMDGLWVSHL